MRKAVASTGGVAVALAKLNFDAFTVATRSPMSPPSFGENVATALRTGIDEGQKHGA